MNSTERRTKPGLSALHGSLVASRSDHSAPSAGTTRAEQRNATREPGSASPSAPSTPEQLHSDTKAPEHATPESSRGEEAAGKDSAYEELASEDLACQELASEDLACQELASEDLACQDPASKGATPQNAKSERPTVRHVRSRSTERRMTPGELGRFHSLTVPIEVRRALSFARSPKTSPESLFDTPREPTSQGSTSPNGPSPVPEAKQPAAAAATRAKQADPRWRMALVALGAVVVGAAIALAALHEGDRFAPQPHPDRPQPNAATERSHTVAARTRSTNAVVARTRSTNAVVAPSGATVEPRPSTVSRASAETLTPERTPAETQTAAPAARTQTPTTSETKQPTRAVAANSETSTASRPENTVTAPTAGTPQTAAASTATAPRPSPSPPRPDTRSPFGSD